MYFINKTATRILDLKNKKLVNYIGNYDYYLEKCDEMTKIYAPETVSLSSGSSSSAGTAPAAKADWKAQKEEQAKLRKIQNEIKKTESRIDELEQIISECDSELANPEYATNVGKLMEIQKSKEAAESELETLYEKWEELNS